MIGDIFIWYYCTGVIVTIATYVDRYYDPVQLIMFPIFVLIWPCFAYQFLDEVFWNWLGPIGYYKCSRGYHKRYDREPEDEFWCSRCRKLIINGKVWKG
jgi:hypothetical protein